MRAPYGLDFLQKKGAHLRCIKGKVIADVYASSGLMSRRFGVGCVLGKLIAEVYAPLGCYVLGQQNKGTAPSTLHTGRDNCGCACTLRL